VTDIAPELDLLRAMFRLVEVDATSFEPSHRADVQRWLHGPGLQWWDDLLGLGGALERHMRQRIAARQAQHMRRDSPQLWFAFADDPHKDTNT
jgi:hypothetical protein